VFAVSLLFLSLSWPDELDVTDLRTAKDPERAEDAVKYIIFLSDANKLFDLALGMYDFPLVLMIAQHSQKVRPSLPPPPFTP
jgi:elongator complex protein 1